MYKLGIDIGTNSIGWAVVEIEKQNDKIIPLNLIDFGVRIFNDGLTQDTKPKSLASVRSKAKSTRVNQDRYLDRRKKLFNLLIKYNLMPTDKSEQKSLELLNPYKCRAECATVDLNKSELIERVTNPLYILGRALFHINQHRGFQSLAEEETSKWEDAHKKLIEEIKNNNCATLGEYKWKIIKTGGKARFSGIIDDNGKLKKDVSFPSRDIYRKEIKFIFEKQRETFPQLSKEIEDEITDIILEQRNLKKQESANCIFDNNSNTQLAQLLFQKFRIISEVNNLEIIYPENKKLSDEDRKKLIEALYNCNKNLKSKNNIVSYLSIKEFLGLDIETLFNFESTKKHKYKGKNEDGKPEYEEIYKPLTREGLKCSETNKILLEEIKDWSSFSENDKFNIIEILTDYSKFAKDRVNNLKEQYDIELDTIKANEILNKLPKGYSKLSKEILEKIIPLMENNNLKYYEVLEKIGISHSLKDYQKEGWIPYTELPPYQKDFTEYLGTNGRITNPTVHIALNQLRIVVNEIIKIYGNPEVIGVEVARDMAQGEKTKKDIAIKQKTNKNINDEAKRAIISCGKNPSDYNMEKYKVWRNLCPNDENKRIDIYDMSELPNPIPLAELFTAKYEIEHILPFSDSNDDSYANKIITKSEFNRKKSEKYPSEYFTDEELKKLLKRAGSIDFYRKKNDKDKEENFKTKKKVEYKLSDTWWRFLPNAKEIYLKLTGGMSARDINDTRYITKLTNMYLNYITNDWKHNTVNTGSATDLYRHSWNLLKAVPRDFDLWIPQKWQQDFLSDKLKEVILSLHPEYNSTDKNIQKKLDSELKEIIEDLIKGNPTKYNNLVDEFEAFIQNQSNKIDDKELLNDNEEDVKTPIIKRNAFDTTKFQFVKVETENLSSDEIKNNCYQIFYNLSSKQKDRAIHYHHAIDAIVCACLDKSLAEYPNKPEFRKILNSKYNECIKVQNDIDKVGLKKSLQQQIISDKLTNENKIVPYKNYNMNELKERFKNMLISYKEENNKIKHIRKGIKEGKNKSNQSFLTIMKDTAYSIMDNKLDSNDNIKFLVKNLSKGKREESINSISSMIPIFRNKEQKKNYLDLFDKYFIVKQKFNDGKITKDEFKKIKEDFENSFTKDKAYKWYASDGNYEAQIYMVDGKWQMEIINRFRVFEHLEAKDGYALWHKIYPNAKKIMTLRANDVVKANIKRDDDCKSFGKLKKFISDRFSYYPDINNLNFYFRVKEMTDGKITLLPIHIAEVDKYTKVWSGSITALQKYNIQKVYLNALGKEINKN